ncbi:hypothetical protein D5R81_18815 [Parashewanella spongiae]|uniref:Uncharacterized protein n=1 Tax=Parashewanella spongiae TaxID=342950 RepID=A0A3A6TJP1_9GAMM|nr:hypothetical protein [Parashewanella spongiae]MCL1079341.1 hypothetical protein [Parashewanella spongiae]RJY05085.1 hypothetical protein D5R81_18815 [Parashewanella spongiae]
MSVLYNENLSIPASTVEVINLLEIDVPIQNEIYELEFKTGSGQLRFYRVHIINNEVESVTRASGFSDVVGFVTGTHGGLTCKSIRKFMNSKLDKLRLKVKENSQEYTVIKNTKCKAILPCSHKFSPVTPSNTLDWLKIAQTRNFGAQTELTLAIVFNLASFERRYYELSVGQPSHRPIDELSLEEIKFKEFIVHGVKSFDLSIKHEMYKLDTRNFEVLKQIKDNVHRLVVINESPLECDEVKAIFGAEGITIDSVDYVENRKKGNRTAQVKGKNKKEEWIKSSANLGKKLLIIDNEISESGIANNLMLHGERSPYQKLVCHSSSKRRATL